MSDIRQSFWDARKYPLIYFAVGYSLAVSSNLAVAVVQQSKVAVWLFGVGAPLVVVLVILTPLFGRLVSRLRLEIAPELLQKARHYRGVVVLISVGPGVATAEAAARYHASISPDLYVWMLASDQSRNLALDLERKLFTENVVKRGHVFLIDLSDDDFENPERVRAAIEDRVYGELPEGIEEHDVVIDVTGGKKTTTAGAFLAALPAGRRMEVNNPRVVGPDGRGVEPGVPMEIVVDYRLKKIARKPSR
ncbi:MAG TPA: hypothetical protein VGJ81_00805 [Thermoanaerobaculia bacterium]|jgi:hypothetical protein